MSLTWSSNVRTLAIYFDLLRRIRFLFIRQITIDIWASSSVVRVAVL